MKKLLSTILALSLLFSMIPAALALESSAPAEELPVEAVIAKENRFPVDSLPEETVQVISAPDSVETTTEDDEALARRARAEARAEKARMEAESGETLPAPAGGFTTMAANCSVTVKVTLPQAAKDDGQVRLSVHVPAVVDENGFVSEYSYLYTSKWVSVSKGSSSASATFTVPAGSYFVSVYTYDAHFGISMNKYHYFNADGSLATNEYTAQPTAISGARAISVSVPKADRTISGTLQFSEPLTEDTWFELYMGTASRWVGNYAYPELFAAKGSTSLSFTLPIAAGSYYLEFRNYANGKWGYYDVNSQLSYNYESRAFINVQDESVSGLVIDGDWITGEVEQVEGDTNRHKLNLTVKLPETLTEYKQYFVLIFNTNNTSELYDWYSYNVSPGSSSFTASFYLQENVSYSLGYLDVTNWSTYSWTDYYPTARYLSEDDGITSLVDNAKSITIGTEDLSVTIDDSNNYKLTGTVALEAARISDLALFPMVEFENGEIFGARTLFWAGDTSKNYTIYVPKNQSGSFTHWAGEATGGLSLMLDEDTVVEGSSYTLTGNLSLATITMPAPEIVPVCTIALPEGMTAPAGGLAMSVYVDDILAGDYFMAAGKNSVTVSAPATSAESTYVSVTLRNPPADLYNDFYLSVEKGDGTTLPIVTIPEAITVSGSVIVPDNAKDGISSFRVYTNSAPESFSVSNSYTYLSALPGETSGTFSLKMVKGVEGRVYARLESDGSGCIMSQNQYLQADGTTAPQNAWVTLTEDTTDVNFTFPQGHTISGTISLEEGIPGDLYSFELHVSGDGGYYTSGSFNGTSGTYKLAVPTDYTGTWRVECYLYYEGSGTTAAMTSTCFYYSENGTTREYSDATRITAPAENIDFVIPAGYPISGTVTFPSELNGYEFGGNVVAIDEDWNYYYGNFSYYNNSYTIMVPTDYTGTYMLGINAHSYNDAIVPGLITTTMYLTEEGTLSTSTDNAKKFTVGEAGLIQDFTLPLGKSFTLNISAPEGFSGYYEGNVALVDENGEYVCEQYFEFSGSSTSLYLTIPADLADGSYALRIYLHYGDGALVDYSRYWSEGGWVDSRSDADFIDFSAGELSVSLPGAKSVNVTVNAPEGFSGYYEGRIYLYEDTDTGYSTVADQYFEFEGSSCSLSLPLPSDSESDCYKVGVYLWSAPGCPTYTYYYYGETGWSTDYDNATLVDFSVESVEITLPKAKLITGKLVSAQGDAITLPENGIGFNLYTSTGSYTSCSCTSDSEGNFTLSVPNDLTGSYYLYCYPSSTDGSNVVGDSYYYKSGADSAVTNYDSSDSTYLFSLDNGDVTGLEIYVDTGYILSGTVELGEGATLTNPDSKTLGRVYASLESENYSTSFSVRLRSDNPDWTYSIAVPKETATYTLSSYLSANSNSVTNIYLGDMDHGTVNVTGDTVLPTISLVPGRATISATITTPLSGYDVNGRVYVVTANGSYSRDFYMDSAYNVSRLTVPVTVAPDDNAETYQLYYYLWNPKGLIRYQNVYVNADGSCTTDSTAASSYSFDVTEHTFTLAEQPPYLAGKIYLPDELDDDDFYVYLYDSFSGTSSIRVHSSTIDEDEDGRKFVSYKKYSSGDYSGSSFCAYYYLNDYTGTALYAKDDYYSRAYLGEDGTFTFGGNSDYHYFTVPNSGCAELDFSLLSWNDGTEDALLQSGHGVTEFVEQTFTFSYPGATYLEVTFDRRTDIDLEINGTYYSRWSLCNHTQAIYLGNTDGVMTITVPALDDLDYTCAFGFAITDIVPYYPSEAAQTPSVAAVYSADGSAEADVMASLAAGETVHVSLVGPVDLTGIVAVAVYDSNGRMIDLIWEGLTFENGVVSLPLNFDNAEAGVTLSVLVLDAASWAPLVADTTLSAEG